MKKRWAVSILALVLGISIGSAPIWACSNMGPDKHMGVVKGIDSDEGLLTLIDAETGKPIRFVTSEKLLKNIKINEKAVITFQAEGDRLITKNIRIH